MDLIAKYHLNQPAKSALAKLRSSGIEPDADEIVLLQEVGKTVLKPPGLDAALLLDLPIDVDGYKLRRLSLAARLWLKECAFPAIGTEEGHDLLLTLATAYAAIHSREPEKLRAWTTVAQIIGGLTEWSKTLTCNWAKLERASLEIICDGTILDDCENAEKASKDTGPDNTLSGQLERDRDALADDWGPYITALVCELGQTPEHWMWDVSERQMENYLGAVSDRSRRLAGDDHVDPVAPAMRAQRAMMTAEQFIRDRHAKKKPPAKKRATKKKVAKKKPQPKGKSNG